MKLFFGVHILAPGDQSWGLMGMPHNSLDMTSDIGLTQKKNLCPVLEDLTKNLSQSGGGVGTLHFDWTWMR